MRIVQGLATRGSQKWLQRAISEEWTTLNQPILSQIGGEAVEWLSPLSNDEYSEYRDATFLSRLGVPEVGPELRKFWPIRGPQWDALGRTNNGALLLVEAKSHIAELCSPGTAARLKSKDLIVKSLEEVALALGAGDKRAAWTDFFYQLANRIAHLKFLRDNGKPAYLILVNFVNDLDMDGPTSAEAWRAAYEIVFHVMGLPKRHGLTDLIIEVFPDVAASLR